MTLIDTLYLVVVLGLLVGAISYFSVGWWRAKRDIQEKDAALQAYAERHALSEGEIKALRKKIQAMANVMKPSIEQAIADSGEIKEEVWRKRGTLSADVKTRKDDA